MSFNETVNETRSQLKGHTKTKSLAPLFRLRKARPIAKLYQLKLICLLSFKSNRILLAYISSFRIDPGQSLIGV